MSADADARPLEPRAREGLTIYPAASLWGGLLASRPVHESARRFREQLGLPLDRSIVMTGHQAEVWHAGILAKYLACDAAAKALGAAAAWIVVDQDDPAVSTSVRCPGREPSGRLVVRELELAEQARDTKPPADSSFDYVNAGLARIIAAWAARASESPPTRRMAATLADLTSPLIPPAPTIFASALARTDLFAALVDAMRRDPGRCVAAFNTAARDHPTAGIRPLVADEVQDRFELPLWRLTKLGPRKRVYADELAAIPGDELAPRALMLTGVLRLAGCELFIHGTGGGGTGDDARHEGYDRVTDDWFSAWAGSDAAVAPLLAPGLAPVATVTATRLLPMASETPPTAAEVARLAWRLHHARHDPGVLGESAAADVKRSLALAVRRERTHSAARREKYTQMHEWLDGYRAAHAGALEALADALRRGSAARAEANIINDRTWPFPLHPQSTLLRLRDEINAAFHA
ncbi:MAG: hypothetical protein ACKVU4_15085 [Phycisphaerales bacterium]